ncbi:MAG: D-alanyl-D-alanine carboxypeptidase family protein [Culicoidibacterales bacterium]
MKKLFTILAVCLFGFGMAVPTVQAETTNLIQQTQTIDAKAALLINAETGQILHEQNIDESLPVYSITKLMSAYLVLDAIYGDNATLTWETELETSKAVSDVSRDLNYSGISLEVGGKYTVRELFEAGLIYSANGPIMVMAEKIGGSEQGFVDLMNQKATELGLTATKYVTSTGLSGADVKIHNIAVNDMSENLMSARDVAILSKALLEEYPEILDVTSVSEKTFDENGEYPELMKNYNWMLPGLIYEYPGVDGLKTGSAEGAYEAAFAATASKDDFRVISVVIGAQDSSTRFLETKKLLDYAFGELKNYSIVTPTSTINETNTFAVRKGSSKEVAVKTDDTIIISSTQAELTFPTYFAPLGENYYSEVEKFTAPIAANEVLGRVTVDTTGMVFLTETMKNEFGADVYAVTAVENNFFLLGMFEDLKDGTIKLFKNLFN